jgi:integrase
MKKIRKRGRVERIAENKYRLRVFVGYSSQGKRRYESETVHCSQKQATKRLGEMVYEIEKGTYHKRKASLDTLNEHLDRWLEVKKKSVGYRTYEGYAGLCRRYVKQTLGKMPIAQIKPVDIQDFYLYLQNKENLSAITVRQVHTALRMAFKQAVKLELITNNPCYDAELPKIKNNERRILNLPEARRFLESVKGERFEGFFTLLLTTGARPEEAIGLRWKDVDFEKGLIYIKQVVIPHRSGGGFQFGDPKTAKSKRTIPLTVSLIDFLQSHREKQLELKSSVKWQNYDLVFASNVGTPLQSKRIFEHFKLMLDKAELPRKEIRLYDLRHSCATLMLLLGVPVKVVSERLGHANITITLNTYAHVLPNMQEEATKQIETAFFPSVRTLLAP